MARYSDNLRVQVVEWIGAQPDNDRGAFWQERFQTEVVLTQVDNVLEFDEW